MKEKLITVYEVLYHMELILWGSHADPSASRVGRDVAVIRCLVCISFKSLQNQLFLFNEI